MQRLNSRVCQCVMHESWFVRLFRALAGLGVRAWPPTPAPAHPNVPIPLCTVSESRPDAFSAQYRRVTHSRLGSDGFQSFAPFSRTILSFVRPRCVLSTMLNVDRRNNRSIPLAECGLGLPESLHCSVTWTASICMLTWEIYSGRRQRLVTLAGSGSAGHRP